MPQQAIPIQDLIRQEATKAGVPPELALSVADQESSFNPTVTGPKLPSGEQAIGTFQILPSTAKTLGIDPHDPVQNIRGGVTYLRQLLDKHQGNLTNVLNEYGGVRTAGPAYATGVIGKIPKYRQAAPSAGGKGGGPGTIGSPLGAGGGRGGPPSLAVGTPPPRPTLASMGRMAVEAYDPRTTTGRQNYGGMAGAYVGGATMGPFGAVLGAGLGGEAAELGEQIFGTKPPSTAAAFGAMGTQAGTEAVGQAIPWAVRGVRQQLIAKPVEREAGKILFGGRAGETERLANAVAATGDLDLPGTLTAPARTGLPPVRGTEGATTFDRGLVGQPPSTEAAGRAATRIIKGPFQTIRGQLGQAVDDAAAKITKIDLTTAKANAQAAVDEIAKSEGTFPRSGTDAAEAGIPAEAAQGFKATYDRSITEAAKDPRYTKLVSDYLKQFPQPATNVLGAADVDVSKNPSMKYLNRILNASDTTTGADVQAWKKELDNGLRDVFGKVQRSQANSRAMQIADDLATELRKNPAYAKAADAYAKVSDVYRSDYVKKLVAEGRTKPDVLVNTINPKSPSQLRFLHEALVSYPAKAGEADAGQQAWNSVRAAWTYKNLLKGGFRGLDANLKGLDPGVAQELFGDAQGKEVFAHLQALSAAYQQTAEKFGATDLGGLSGEQVGAHAMRATMGPMFGLWTMLSRAKLLMGGPAEKDLIEWAAYSPENTRKALYWMTGTPASGLILADMQRAGVPMTVLNALARSQQKPTVGQPPPTKR